MNPEQLRRLAARLEAAQPFPRIDDSPGDYMLHYTVRLLARFFREMAEEDEAHAEAVGHGSGGG